MSATPPPPVVIDPPGTPRASVIWLHGLGADAYDFVPIVRELRLPSELGLRFVFPNAPERPVTINGGHVMPAWFDLVHADLSQAIDHAGIAASAQQLLALADAERARGVAPERVLLAGFSQGGVVALHAALEATIAPGGVLALSTWLVEPPSVKAAEGLPIFMAHGDADPIVPMALAQRSAARLQELGSDTTLHRYPMAHSVCPAEIGDIAAWLERQLA